MSSIAVYGLEVPPLNMLIPSTGEDSIPNAAYRITMAAIDPTEAPQADEDGNIPNKPRATLKLIRQKFADLDEEMDNEYLDALMGGSDDDEEDSDDEEANGGPSDPSKSKKAKAEAALQKLIQAAQEEEEESDDEMADADAKVNGKKGKKAAKGKEPATSSDDDEEDSDDDDEGYDMEEFVICTLDTERNYQQPIDITIGPKERVFFRVVGTHAIHLTGNYIVEDIDDEDDEDEEDYDDFPNELEEMYGEGSDSEEDELDGLDDPRITEVDSEEEAPKLAQTKKGKNKRAAEEEAESLDAMIAKADAAEDKNSKKQQKKLKNNKGEAVETKAKESPKDAKKVQFAKNLEQGPTGPAANAEKGATPGVKVVQGVTIDDRKIGKGRPAKNGNKVGVRYIGKLQDGKVFDSNKKGKPFTFGLGKGEVIKGWEIGLEGMQVGGERRITIPPKLAYGSRSQPGIPGNSTLVFDIKLLEIK